MTNNRRDTTATVRVYNARSGTAYVIVLGAAMIVGVVSLAAVRLLRVEHYAVSISEQAVKARFYGQSMIEVVLHRIRKDLDWRTTIANETWSADEHVGEVNLSYKLVDEKGNDSADYANDRIRLFARATVGDAVRLYSVLLDAVPSSAGSNILTNGDMESGITAWVGSSGGGADLVIARDGSHGGTNHIWVKNRQDPSSGPSQDISGVIENGALYEFEAWVRMKSTTANVKFQIKTNDTSSGVKLVSAPATSVGTGWTRVVGTVTPNWSGFLIDADVQLVTESETGDFKIDDISVRKAGGVVMKLVEGSWRRDVIP